jgi:hypothetical protein
MLSNLKVLKLMQDIKIYKRFLILNNRFIETFDYDFLMMMISNFRLVFYFLAYSNHINQSLNEQS